MDYDKLRKKRDSISKKENLNLWAARAGVLARIVELAFTNEEDPDTIPSSFVLRECALNSNELISLLQEELGLALKSIHIDDLDEPLPTMVVFLR